jgi:protein-disulfide isomerase
MTRFSRLDRRRFLELGAASGLTIAGAGLVLSGSSAPARAQAAKADNISMVELMAPGALEDVWEGSKDAPVTMVEYASMTCSHCAHFHEATYPHLKKNYIETGKVRFVIREFPFDPLATAAFMLARCAGDKRNALVDMLFSQQKNWAFSNQPLQGLKGLTKQAGMADATFDACLKDQKLYENVTATAERGGKQFGVDSTPTFFINGKRVSGAIGPDELDSHLQPLLKS